MEVRIVPAMVGDPPILTAMSIPTGTINPDATIRAAGGGGSPAGFSPQQIRTAFGFDGIFFGSVAGDGAGQTIAIVDAYDQPGFVNSSAPNFATSDLAAFDRQFGLPDPPSFNKMNQYGGTTGLPGTDPAGPGSSSGNWEYEEAMDVEWAHALAPAASIVLVEANTSGSSDLYAAISTADHLPGVSTISLSWGSSEFAGEIQSDRDFQTPNHHQGVTFIAAAGDGGNPGIYPAFSPNVVAVGGTTVQLNFDGSIQSQSAWPSGGGGTSQFESQPSYQDGVQNTGFRTSPDVSFLADRSTGVAVYDSYDDTGGGPWSTMGGTSLGAPAWAALIAIADQGRVAAGGTSLDGATQTLPALYSLPSSDFHDITSGGNGSANAGPGYDQVTGLGTPVANLLAPDLAFYGMAEDLVISAQPPASVTAGQPLGLTVEVERPDGSLASDASGTITISLASTPGGASLSGTLTAPIVGGIATFTGLAIDQAGSRDTLVVSGAGLGSATSSPFDVTAADPKVLVIEAQPPTSVMAGGAFGLTVDVEDAFGNLVTGYGSQVTIGLIGASSGAGLGGTLSVAASGGVASFSGLTIDQAGSGYTIEASGTGLASADTTPVVVTPAAPSQIVLLAGPPSSLSASERFGLTVGVEDAFGNLASGYGGDVTIRLAGGPAGASLGGTLTEPASGGVATFSGLGLSEAGSGYVIAAASGSLPTVQSTAFDVTPTAPAKLVITQPPSATLVAGVPFALRVSVEDAFGNVETGYEGRIGVAVQTGPAGASLVGQTTLDASRGVAAFSGLTLDRAAGVYVLKVDAEGVGSVSTNPFQVVAAAPSRLVVVDQPPSQVTAGQSFGLTMAAEDPYGNIASGYHGTVIATLATDPAGGSLFGEVVANAVDGTAKFSGLALNTAGAGYAIQIASGGLTSTATTPMTVVPGAPSRLIIIAQPPGSVIAKQPFAIGVEAVDAYGNAATSFDGTVTASLARENRGNKLRGTLSVQANGGQAVIPDGTLERAGKSFAITITSSGLTPAATSVFDVIRPADGGFAGAVRRASQLYLRGPKSSRSHLPRTIDHHRLKAHAARSEGSSGDRHR
jgi:hypothetical protein